MSQHLSSTQRDSIVAAKRGPLDILSSSTWQISRARSYLADLQRLIHSDESDAAGSDAPLAIVATSFEAGERARFTLDSIGDAVVCSDINGCITYLNASAEKMTGWSC